MKFKSDHFMRFGEKNILLLSTSQRKDVKKIGKKKLLLCIPPM